MKLSKYVRNIFMKDCICYNPLLCVASPVVQVGDRLKQSKRKTSIQEVKKSRKDWGKGMACVGRTKICSIVPSSHRGPIPGIEVGMCWLFRLQVGRDFNFTTTPWLIRNGK